MADAFHETLEVGIVLRNVSLNTPRIQGSHTPTCPASA